MPTICYNTPSQFQPITATGYCHRHSSVIEYCAVA